ncbi:IS256 family transposase, partial [Rhizobium sp. 2TAF27]|uniref:IS256 family transposase n=1 Tax=Rhizobium sp. 2TAF27 TaxID=3233013 RepID=UPI003F9C110D
MLLTSPKHSSISEPTLCRSGQSRSSDREPETYSVNPESRGPFVALTMNELKSRGCQDILIAVVDGLKGFPEAITAVFPQTIVQTCIVHLIRHSLEFVSYKDRKPVMPALRAIYRARDAEAGLKALEAFEEGYWGQKYPAISQSWRRNWEHVVPFFAFPEGVRRIIYTTNAIEALNSKLRRAVRSRGHFPGDEAAMKLLYLVLNNAAEQWIWCSTTPQSNGSA